MGDQARILRNLQERLAPKWSNQRYQNATFVHTTTNYTFTILLIMYTLPRTPTKSAFTHRKIIVCPLSLDRPHPSCASSPSISCAERPRVLRVLQAPWTPDSWQFLYSQTNMISDLNEEQKPNQYQRTLPKIVPICTKKAMLACVRHENNLDNRMDKITEHVHDFIVVVREERDCGTLLTSTSSTTCTVISQYSGGLAHLGKIKMENIPIRWTYASIVFAIWKLITRVTSCTSIPRPARSVATKISASPVRSAAKAASR